ncbi:hypothetical protein [Geobacter argillaceus]|uniref:Uncharacterized protein n=1 Tax=Geobacter argillaceus TaxID=345631 RepID=A0A562V852_9BACT|nr:hypothetical protein [Geobacter argillaceus]TWJ14022.1 hypothetical protein JN12_03593 [Geobacter argillaceus]
MNLQTHYDMEVALEALEDRLDKEVRRGIEHVAKVGSGFDSLITGR